MDPLRSTATKDVLSCGSRFLLWPKEAGTACVIDEEEVLAIAVVVATGAAVDFLLVRAFVTSRSSESGSPASLLVVFKKSAGRIAVRA